MSRKNRIHDDFFWIQFKKLFYFTLIFKSLSFTKNLANSGNREEKITREQTIIASFGKQELQGKTIFQKNNIFLAQNLFWSRTNCVTLIQFLFKSPETIFLQVNQEFANTNFPIIRTEIPKLAQINSMKQTVKSGEILRGNFPLSWRGKCHQLRQRQRAFSRQTPTHRMRGGCWFYTRPHQVKPGVKDTCDETFRDLLRPMWTVDGQWRGCFPDGGCVRKPPPPEIVGI